MTNFSDINPLLILPLIIAITFHEAAHGFVAYAFGDDTAKRLKRVTLNPLRHIDPLGTIILPAILILSHSPALVGYAKPVPVNFSSLTPKRLGVVMVAFAGPLMNLMLAFICALALHLDTRISPEEAPWLFESLYLAITVNCLLAAFNLLPILPLDGGRIFNEFLPRTWSRIYSKSERYGMVIVILIFMLPAFLQDANLPSLPFSTYLIYMPMDFIRDGILYLAGISNN